MRDLNIDFLDLYKSVDRFIKDAYSSGEGISEYIRQMEASNYKGIRYVRSWSNDYDMLKHVRWVRNQLAHEVGYDSDICEENDYEWLESFSQRIFKAEDPLASLTKQEKAERQRCAAEQRQRQAALREQQRQSEPPGAFDQERRRKPSFWERIKRFFSGS